MKKGLDRQKQRANIRENRMNTSTNMITENELLDLAVARLQESLSPAFRSYAWARTVLEIARRREEKRRNG